MADAVAEHRATLPTLLAGTKRTREEEPRPTVSYVAAPAQPDDASEFDAAVAPRALLSWAVVCMCNMNRSMSAHARLTACGFTRVRSYGSGEAVRLPSSVGNGVASFRFGTRYSDIARHMECSQAAWLASVGLKDMLQRNASVKPHPESWHTQPHHEALGHDIIVCYDTHVYSSVVQDYTIRARLAVKPRRVHCAAIVLLHTADTAQAAADSARITEAMALSITVALHDAVMASALDRVMSTPASDRAAASTPIKTLPGDGVDRESIDMFTPPSASARWLSRASSADSVATVRVRDASATGDPLSPATPSFAVSNSDSATPREFELQALSPDQYRHALCSCLSAWQRRFPGMRFRLVDA